MKEQLLSLIGTRPKENGFIKRMRFHQGWWRAFVLAQKEGEYLDIKKNVRVVCNRINGGDKSHLNFLNQAIIDSVAYELTTRSNTSKGMIAEDRLYDNLLSSQPLAFNFFSMLAIDENKNLANSFIRTILPNVVNITDVVFEFAPEWSEDGSAFDLGFFVETNNGETGFIGFECKYTDPFSFKNKDTGVIYGDTGSNRIGYYQRIFDLNRDHVINDYFSYIRNPSFNQLFRNEIIGCTLKKGVNNGIVDFVYTGLFCHENDVKTIEAGQEFQKTLQDGDKKYIILTQFDFIERIQKLKLTKVQREWTMLLWARYSGKLSERVYP
jgi:hypothetical protein